MITVLLEKLKVLGYACSQIYLGCEINSKQVQDAKWDES